MRIATINREVATGRRMKSREIFKTAAAKFSSGAFGFSSLPFRSGRGRLERWPLPELDLCALAQAVDAIHDDALAWLQAAIDLHDRPVGWAELDRADADGVVFFHDVDVHALRATL